LVAGAKLLSPETRIVGISVAGTADTISAYVRTVADSVLTHLGVDDRVADEEVIVFDDYLGEGYGILTDEIVATVGRVAREEGVLLDPVYTGKAMTGLIDLAGRGYFGDEEVVFLHTGGTPALFPYRGGILRGLGR
jgi:1-aminocyclopropane-1-carboxylate deaminase/D-cysteine desulfhydrase-like pyridoxal-dependent ACC family enzyme